MITDGFARNTQAGAMRRVKWCATLWRIPRKSREIRFDLYGSGSRKKTRNVVLALVLVLAGIGLILARGLVSARASRRATGKGAISLSERIRLMADLIPRIETTIPMFYINLAANRDRAAYMEYVYSGAGNSLTRIPAVNGRDRDMLRRRLEMNHTVLVEYDGASARHIRSVTQKHFDAVPGEIATILSHLDAIYAAHQNPAIDIALVMEDDAADLLFPYWPGKLEDLVNLANEIDPEWAAIRLQWHPVTDSIWSEWVIQLSNWSAKVGSKAALVELHNTWRRTGRLPMDSKPPLIMPYASGWGAVATLYSRRGMDVLMTKHFAGLKSDKLQDRGYNGNTAGEDGGLPRWSCPETRPCVSDLSFWFTLEPHVFVATPPWFTYRTAEVETGVREGHGQSNHVLLHLQSVARALQWMISFDEAFKPGGGPNLPWGTAWQVSELQSTNCIWKKLQNVFWASNKMTLN